MDKYTETECQQEMDLVLSNPGTQLGSLVIRCPHCNTLGFYSPRFEKRPDVDRKYRACKFCGFAQELTGYALPDYPEPYRWVMLTCPKCPGGYYDWRVPKDTSPKRCSQCGTSCIDVDWPTKDPNHPFHMWKAQFD